MNNFDPKVYLKLAEKDRSYCWEYYHDYEQFMHMPKEAYHTDEYEWVRQEFEYFTVRLYLKILALAEFYNLDKIADQLEKEFNSFDDLLESKHSSYQGEITSKVLVLLDSYLQSLYAISGIDRKRNKNDQEEVLKRILESTPSIIQDHQIEPNKENVVRNEVFNHLKYIFSDASKEIQLPKVVKNFRGDIGIRSLKTVIEYKFADDKEEVKKAIGGIYEDMLAYSGSLDWNKFFAVVYQTDHFYTINQVKAELEVSDTKDNWHVILVSGSGSRS